MGRMPRDSLGRACTSAGIKEGNWVARARGENESFESCALDGVPEDEQMAIALAQSYEDFSAGQGILCGDRYSESRFSYVSRSSCLTASL